MTELNKGIIQDAPVRQDENYSNAIEEVNELNETDGSNNYATPLKQLAN
jgi:hypothetical protein